MKKIISGKVRDVYEIDNDRLVIVTTDRISAFDVILSKPVKDKGKVLNSLSLFWFDYTKDIVRNHVISDKFFDMPEFFQRHEFEGRTVMVEKLNILPFEFIVRGYIFGNMWNAYSEGIIIADTKFEFGFDKNNNIVLADEIFTPDSSRFWSLADYRVGVSPKSYDKQFIRDWLTDNKVNGEIQFNNVPDDVINRTSEIYQECLHM